MLLNPWWFPLGLLFQPSRSPSDCLIVTTKSHQELMCCGELSAASSVPKLGDLYKTSARISNWNSPRTASLELSLLRSVLTDSFYGESGDVISVLERLNLPFIVAIRSNHGVLVAPGKNCALNRAAWLCSAAISSTTRNALYPGVVVHM